MASVAAGDGGCKYHRGAAAGVVPPGCPAWNGICWIGQGPDDVVGTEGQRGAAAAGRAEREGAMAHGNGKGGGAPWERE